VLVDSTVFYPQGGGQPADTGVISAGGGTRFIVDDVRMKDGVVFHYGRFEDAGDGCNSGFSEGQSVSLEVDAERRNLNSRCARCKLVLRRQEILLKSSSLKSITPYQPNYIFSFIHTVAVN
jgi:Ser-tRNA(Ala) deacylase AlaX